MNKNNQTHNLSHHKDRAFKPEKINPPRNFDSQSWQWLTQSKNESVLEIGAGKGLHAIQFAAQNKDKTIIAIERTAEKFAAFNKNAQPKNLANLYPVHADAIAWSVFALPAQSISQAFILYPNPERNNANQQWLNMPYFEFLLSRLKNDATITLASNIMEYLDNAQAQSTEVWQLPTTREVVDKTSSRTHFEIKYLARGEPCEQLVITKPDGYVTRFDNDNPEPI